QSAVHERQKATLVPANQRLPGARVALADLLDQKAITFGRHVRWLSVGWLGVVEASPQPPNYLSWQQQQPAEDASEHGRDAEAQPGCVITLRPLVEAEIDGDRAEQHHQPNENLAEQPVTLSQFVAVVRLQDLLEISRFHIDLESRAVAEAQVAQFLIRD